MSDALASAPQPYTDLAAGELGRAADASPGGPDGLLRVLLFGQQPRLWQDVLRRRVLAGADLVASFLVCFFLGASVGPETGGWALIFVPAWLLLAKLFGLYDRDHRALRHLTIDELPAILLWALSAAATSSLLLTLTPVGGIGLAPTLAVWGIAASAAIPLRGLARFIWRRLTPPEQALIVGEGPLADATRRKLELFPDIHVALVGERDLSSSLALLSSPDRPRGVTRVIVASSSVEEELMSELVSYCRREQLKLSLVPPLRGIFGTAVQLNHVAELPIVEYNTWDVSRSTLLLKRGFDLAVSIPLLIVTAPMIAAIALAVRLSTEGPAFFVQRRAGLNGRLFRMVKFRTMVADAEERLPEVVCVEELVDPMFKLNGDPRVTRLGRFLRRTSLDELPQLLNVAKGDMSLVGPRPEQVELVERYRPEHMFRLAVKPGLTGPMQVYGRGALRLDERLAVERDYIENLSLGRDLRILALTLTAVVTARGAY